MIVLDVNINKIYHQHRFLFQGKNHVSVLCTICTQTPLVFEGAPTADTAVLINSDYGAVEPVSLE